LINKYLKHHFKFQKVFHSLWKTCGKPSSNESEKKVKTVLLQHFLLLSSKRLLSNEKAEIVLQQFSRNTLGKLISKVERAKR